MFIVFSCFFVIRHLKAAYLVNVPSVFKFAWKLIYPWIDPKTREKVHLLKEL